MQWASKNNILVNQEYEYSDMIPEYKIISQDDKNLELYNENEIKFKDGCYKKENYLWKR